MTRSGSSYRGVNEKALDTLARTPYTGVRRLGMNVTDLFYEDGKHRVVVVMSLQAELWVLESEWRDTEYGGHWTSTRQTPARDDNVAARKFYEAVGRAVMRGRS